MYQRCLSILLCGTLLASCSDGNYAPRAVLFNPSQDSTSANRDVVRVQFNEEVLASSVGDDAITVMLDGEPVPGIIRHGATDSDNNPILKDLISFFPEERLKLLTAYDATIKSGISDLDGNKTKDPIHWSFTVRDGSFSGPGLVETDDDGDALEPQIAMSTDDGDGFMIWRQDDGTNFDIIVKRLSSSPSDPNTRISDGGNTNDALAPQIAVSSDGTAVAVWSQSDGANSRIYANLFDGDSWDSAQPIDAGAGGATAPQIALDSNGQAIAVWVENDRIYANRFNGTWTGAAPIDANAGGVSAPQVAIDLNDEAIAIWVESDRVYVNRFSGTWGAATPIDGNTGTPTAPQIATRPDNGNPTADAKAIAVWSQSDGMDIDIVASRYTNAGGWSASQIVDEDTIDDADGDPIDLGNAVTPQVVMDPSGNAIAVWVQEQGTSLRNRIFSSRLKASSNNWAAPERIENFGSGIESTEPQIAIDGLGNALCVWSAFESDRNNIVANRYRSDFDDWTSPILLEDDIDNDNGDADSPQLAVAPDFTAVVIWTKQDVFDDPGETDDDTDQRQYNIQANAFN